MIPIETEAEILRLYQEGLDVKQLAERCGVSRETARTVVLYGRLRPRGAGKPTPAPALSVERLARLYRKRERRLHADKGTPCDLDLRPKDLHSYCRFQAMMTPDQLEAHRVDITAGPIDFLANLFSADEMGLDLTDRLDGWL
jgi:Homeodomain-like domain